MIDDFLKLHHKPEFSECIFSVPANLLLLGEYAVTEEDGHGIWLAPECRAVLRIVQGSPGQESGLQVEGTWSTGKHVASLPCFQGAPSKSSFPLLASCLETLGRYLGRSSKELAFRPGKISVDTRALSKGYGTSAASTILVCASLILMLDPSSGIKKHPVMGSKEDFLQLAIEAHRSFQNGAGSGYDIAASLFGSCGLFLGGLRPRARVLELPDQLGFLVHRGDCDVPTSGSLVRYRAWKQEHPEEASRWKQSCTEFSLRWIELCGQYSESDRTDCCGDFIELLARAKTAGMDLGRSIGVPADLPDPFKALGAGNEWGICLLSPCLDGCPDFLDGESLTVSKDGLRLEYLA